MNPTTQRCWHECQASMPEQTIPAHIEEAAFTFTDPLGAKPPNPRSDFESRGRREEPSLMKLRT